MEDPIPFNHEDSIQPFISSTENVLIPLLAGQAIHWMFSTIDSLVASNLSYASQIPIACSRLFKASFRLGTNSWAT